MAVVLALFIAFDAFLVLSHSGESLTDLPVFSSEEETEETAYSDPVERQARELVSGMTLYEKIGQMLLYYIPKEQPLEKMERWQFGGYIMFSRNFEHSTPFETRMEIAAYQTAAKVPAFIAVDEEGGGVNRISQFPQYRSEPFKSGIRLYMQGGWEAVEADTVDKAEFLRDLGFNTVLAPVADVPYSRSDYIYPRAFSTDAELVSEYITKVVSTYNTNGFLSCVKHFPGYANNVNTHTGTSTDRRSWADIEQRDLLPFKAGIEQGVPFLMVSHNIFEDFDPGVPASLSAKMHSYIREDMGYDGIIVCDGLGMQGVKDYVGGDKGEVAVQAVIAGNDMLCATDVGVQLRAIAAAVEAGRIPIEQIEDSATKVLMTKIKYGLIERKY